MMVEPFTPGRGRVGTGERDGDLGVAVDVALDVPFDIAFDAAPIGMALVDGAERIVRVNAAISHLVGMTAADLIGRGVCSLVHHDDAVRAMCAIRSALRNPPDPPGRWVVDHRVTDASGAVRWVTTHLARIDRVGQPPQVLVHMLDVTDHRMFQERLRHLEDHDALTGLLNRRSFDRVLASHLDHVHRSGPRGAVLLLDLDNFMYINDSLGHQHGDELIKRVADVVLSHVGPRDVLARLGGDEFAVFAPDMDRHGAERVADRLLDAIRSVRVDLGSPAGRTMTASVGIALFDGSHTGVDEVLVAADLAMYDAKDDGRDRWIMASPDTRTTSRTMTKMTWVERIRSALGGDALQLYAQPIMDLATGASSQCELLLRMQAEDGTVVLPGQFLAIAEHLDLIQRIDRWVTEAAIDYLRTTSGVTVEVNLSGATLGDPTLLDVVQRRLSDTGVDPRRLVFEITETAAIANIADAHHFATTLAQIGCRFALDDFGAGFGSFYYVKHLPFDFVKIDGEFIANATTNPTDQAIIRSIVAIARELGKSTIAEHTRDAATLELLRELGVEYAQGFHIGHPTPLASWRPTVAETPRLPAAAASRQV